jgi:outer membrane protein TolC
MIPPNRLHGCRLGWFATLVLSGCHVAPLANHLPWNGKSVASNDARSESSAPAVESIETTRARGSLSDDANGDQARSGAAMRPDAERHSAFRQVAYLQDPLAKTPFTAQSPMATPDKPTAQPSLNPAATAVGVPAKSADTPAQGPSTNRPDGEPAAAPDAKPDKKTDIKPDAEADAKAAAESSDKPASDKSSDKPASDSDGERPLVPPGKANGSGRPRDTLPPPGSPNKPAAAAGPKPPRPVLALPSLPGEAARPPQPDGEEVRSVLPLRSVIESVYYSFPALEAAMREADIADGKRLAASGEFDLKVKAESMSLATGFYDNYRNLVKLEQALMPGGSVYGQYRIGDGSFPEYYRDRETNEGGEFKIGWQTPLMRNRAIDQRRADIFQATLRREQVDPFVQGLLLEFTYGAADAYWSWVAAGLSYDAQRDLLRVTEERNKQFEERVKQEDLAAIELVQNERLIASRQAKVVEAERKLQQAAIKLSLFFRDGQGRPVMPPPSMLPDAFPEPTAPDRTEFAAAVEAAVAQRPEIRELDLQRQQAEVDLSLGENMRLPSFDAVIQASKDVGAPASKKGDKTPFELEAGLMFELPLQRRKADGKIREASGKLSQLAAKREFTQNKIANQVQDAQSALATSFDRVALARRNVTLARRLEAAERQRFDAEDSDLLRVALQEAAEIEATLLEFDTLADYFKARAALRAAIGADPLANNDE